MNPQESLFESNEPPLQAGERFRVTSRDAVEWLRGIRRESVDLIFTDPAYESLEKHRKVGTTTRLTKKWFPIFPNERYEEFFYELYRVLKPDSHAYVMCDHETMFVIKPVAEAVGFKFWKPIVWDKVNPGMGYHYSAQYEMILFFEKGYRKLNDASIRDVQRVKKVYNGYPTEKPVPLVEKFILNSTEEGELAIDPFTGSGSTGEAALRHGRRFAGCDILDDSVEEARARLGAL